MNRLRHRSKSREPEKNNNAATTVPKSTKKGSRRRLKRSNSKDSNISYDGGGNESDTSVVSNSYHKKQQQQQYIQPPSYNQPAYQPSYFTPAPLGGNNGGDLHRRTNSNTNHSRSSDDDGGYSSLDDSNRFKNQKQMQKSIQKQVYREQQQQQQQQEQHQHANSNSPSSPKPKKGLRKFLPGKGGRKHKSDESLSSRNSSRRPFGKFRKNSQDSDDDADGDADADADYSNAHNALNQREDGIPHALSFGQNTPQGHHSNGNARDFSDIEYDYDNSNGNDNDNEHDNDYDDHDYKASHTSYNAPMADHSESESHRSGGSGNIWNRSQKHKSKGRKKSSKHVRENRSSLNQNEHLQISDDNDDGGYSRGRSGSRSASGSNGGWDSSRSSSDDDDYDDDEEEYMDDSGEFSLNMVYPADGKSGVDDSNPIDYYHRLSRHQKDLASQNLQAIESLARKDGKNPVDEAFMIFPDHSYPNTKMTRRQLRKEMNKGSAYYHDLRMPKINAQSKSKELGRLRVEVLQCFGLPTTSLVREVSAYSVAVMGNAAFQTDVIPNVANPMWLSKMRRACLFPVEQMFSQLSIGIFDLEAAYADPNTCMGHPGHPGWIPPDQRGGWGMNRATSFAKHAHQSSGSIGFSETRRGSAFSENRRGSAASIPFIGDSGKNFVMDDEEEKNVPMHRQPAPYCVKAEDFIGHVVVDVCRLRPGSTYDVTLPLRRSKHVFTREPQGSVRIRLHLEWDSERAAVMSYLPKTLGGTVSLQKHPNNRHTVNCVDDRAARNVAHAVHGIHMPGKFDMTLLKSTIREIHWTRIHLLRYCKNREIYHLTHWVYPSISGFVFLAWMHAVYYETVRYVPGHVVVFFLLHLLKNYAYYAMDSPLQNGFQASSLEELYWALMSGTKKRKKPCIEPLTVEREADPMALTVSDQDRVFNSNMNGRGNSTHNMDELYDESGNLVRVSRFPLSEIAEAMKKSLKVRPHRKGFTVFKHTFQGDDAVDFLLLNGFAMTRPEAVSVGRRLEREKRLFRHIGKENYFEDSNYLYCFLDSETDGYLVKRSHAPAGARMLELLGFYSRKGSAGGKNHKKGKAKPGGADILESREHVEFPFATGVDHPRFTVKESLVIRSAEEKSRLNKETEAKAMVEVAEFGIVPSTQGSLRGSFSQPYSHGHGGMGYESESGTRNTGLRRGSQRNLMTQAGNGGDGVGYPAGRPTRRGSSLGAALANGATAVAVGANTMTASLAGTIRGTNHHKMINHNGSGHMHEVVTGEEMLYNKLKEQNNATLDRVMELQRKADEYDPYEYDSDNDVKTIQKKKRKKHVIFEKHLKKPISQDFGNMGASAAVDMSLVKSLQKSKRHVSGIFRHMFDDQVYKIDKNLFPIRLVEKKDNQVKKKKKRGLFQRRVSNRELEEEEERQKKTQMTPYEQQQEEIDKVLMINQFSHYNPWINRIAIVMQPLLEMAQTFLFAFRALFNVFTWQDPVLCFWLCFTGPPLAFVLYVCPYRFISFFLGFYWIGPQNYVLRIYRESKESYEPPNFDLIVKKKKIEKPEDFQEMQFFSSEAPGNQPIQFRNIDPVQVKQIVVPSNVMMYGSRFYDWPPEPKYARVYASEAPSNLMVPGFAERSGNNHDNNNHSGYESDSTYVFDQAARKKAEEEREKIEKKKRKNVRGVGRKFTDGLKKTTQLSIGVVETAGEAVFTGTEQVFGATAGVTVGAVKGTARVVKGTSKQAKSAAKGTGNFLRLRKRKGYKNSQYNYSDDEDEYY